MNWYFPSIRNYFLNLQGQIQHSSCTCTVPDDKTPSFMDLVDFHYVDFYIPKNMETKTELQLCPKIIFERQPCVSNPCNKHQHTICLQHLLKLQAYTSWNQHLQIPLIKAYYIPFPGPKTTKDAGIWKALTGFSATVFVALEIDVLVLRTRQGEWCVEQSLKMA